MSRLAGHRETARHRNVPKEPCQRSLDAISRNAARLLRDANNCTAPGSPRLGPLSTNIRETRRLFHALSTVTAAIRPRDRTPAAQALSTIRSR